MSKYNPEITSKNIKLLRDAAGLTQPDFADMLEISIRTVASLEKGDVELDLDTLHKLKAFFYMYTLTQLSTKEITVEDNLREKMLARFRKKIPKWVYLLEKDPTIIYAIKYKLIPSGTVDEFVRLNKITKYFKSLGWKFKSSSVTNALKRSEDDIVYMRHDTLGYKNVYKKKN